MKQRIPMDIIDKVQEFCDHIIFDVLIIGGSSFSTKIRSITTKNNKYQFNSQTNIVLPHGLSGFGGCLINNGVLLVGGETRVRISGMDDVLFFPFRS